MACCCSGAKSIIKKLLLGDRNDDNIKSGTAQISPTSDGQENEARDDDHDDKEDYSLSGIANPSALIQSSERLDHIGSWPAWKRLLDSRRTGASLLYRSWVLDRVPDPAPFKPMRNMEDILAALEFSYQNCIFEGPHRSEHPGSILYGTSLDRIAKFGCCTRCKTVAGALKPELPMLEPYYSRSKKVMVWCGDWGNLEADGVNEAVVAKAFQDGTVFLTIIERSTELTQTLKSANEEFLGGDEVSFHKSWLATIQSDHHWSFVQNILRTCQQFHESCRYNRQGFSLHIPRRLISIGSHPMDLRLSETDERDRKSADAYT